MSLQLVKQEDGSYKVVADVVVPQVVEKVFQTAEEALASFKAFEGGSVTGEPEAVAQPETPAEPVEPTTTEAEPA